MENKKIKVKVEENILRLSIPSENGTIVINNPTQNYKKELLGMIVDLITEKKDFDEKKIMSDLINHCTNVEFEGDIFESTNLSHEAQVISNEILIIFQEIVSEAYQLLQLAIQQAKGEMLQDEILKEKDNVLDIVEKIQNEKETEIVENKKEKRPNRPRGRAYRK